MLTTQPSLLDRLRRSPEQSAWERFVDMYTPLLFAWTNRLGLSGHDAADLVQDLFTVLVEKLPTFQYDANKSFRAWLKTVLFNRWRNALRRREVENQVAGGSAIDEFPGQSNTPEIEEAEYRKHLVRRAFQLMQAEFEPNTWKACWEYVVLDRPAPEVAKSLGITINAVYLAKSRVLRRLREELNGLLE